MFPITRALLLVSTLLSCGSALAQQPATLGDLDALGAREVLSREALQQLLPGAKVRRVSGNGSQQELRNDADGVLWAVSHNLRLSSTSGVTNAQGKWSVSDNGRYCVRVDWRSVEAEEWCRFVFKVGDAYYMSSSEKTPTARVFKFEIVR